MGTIIKPSLIKSQANSIIQQLTAENESLEAVIPVIDNFKDSTALESDAWTGLKSHMGGHASVIKGLVCANVDVMYDSEQLSTLSGDEDLDEDKIKADIAKYERENAIQKSNVEGLLSAVRLLDYTSDLARMPGTRESERLQVNLNDAYNIISGNAKLIAELNQKLTKIAEIVAATEWLYRQASVAYSQVETGISQLQTSGSGSSFTGVAGGAWQQNLDQRWNDREEVKAERQLLNKEGFTKEQIDHMKSIGYSPTEMLREWQTLETDEDKKFYKLMATGTRESYLEAFKINPDLVSDKLSMALGNYVLKLGDHLDQLTTLNQALLDSDEFYTPDGALTPSGTTFRDKYLEKITSAILASNGLEFGLLSDKYIELMNKGINPETDPEYLSLKRKYEQNMKIGNFFLTETLFIEQKGAINFNASGIHYDKQGNLVFDMSYQKIPVSKGKGTDNLIIGMITSPDLYGLMKDSEALRKIMRDRDNLLLKTLVEGVLDLSGGLLMRYGNNGAKLIASLSSMLRKDKFGTVYGLDSYIQSNSGKVAFKEGNIVLAMFLNYLASQQSSGGLSAEAIEAKMKWFGTGVYYQVGGEHFISSIGINDPKIMYYITKWKEEGLNGWIGEGGQLTEDKQDELIAQIKDQLEKYIKAEKNNDSPDNTNINSYENQQEMLQYVLKGRDEETGITFSLDTNEEILAFNDLITNLELGDEYKGEIINGWKTVLNK